MERHRAGLVARVTRVPAAGSVAEALQGDEGGDDDASAQCWRRRSWSLLPATAHGGHARCRRRDRLKDRREVAAGTRAYSIGFQDGRFYANGWHITGEMGGVWAPPLKLADGVWFGVDDQWVGPATRFTSGRGYARYALPADRRAARCAAPTSSPTAAARRCSGSQLANPRRAPRR